jgi:hypothetical protein
MSFRGGWSLRNTLQGGWASAASLSRRSCETMIAPPEASGSDARSPDTLSPSVTRLHAIEINNLCVTEGVTDENRSGYTSILVTDVTCNRWNFTGYMLGYG